MGSLVRPTISTAVTVQKSMHPRRLQQHSRPKDRFFFFSDGRLCTLNGDAF